MEEWGQILIALLTGGALTALIKGTIGIIKKRMELRSAFPEAIKKIKKIYSLMDELKAEVECDRVLIMSTKNGGGIPRPGAHLYASVLYETFDKKMEAVMPYWQQRQVDLAYVKVLSGLEEYGVIEIDTVDIDDGLLKDIYISHGVKKSIVAKIKSTSNHYYYLSCNFTSKNSANLQAKVKISDVAIRIRDII